MRKELLLEKSEFTLNLSGKKITSLLLSKSFVIIPTLSNSS